MPEGWATGEAIVEYQPKENSESLYPGGKALSVHSSGQLALVGGAEGVVGVYSLVEKRVVQTLQTNGPVTDALWAGDKAVVASATGVVKVFENGNEVAAFNSHAGEVSGLALHATGDIVASVGPDKSYVLYDLTTNTAASQIFSDACKNPIPYIICTILSIPLTLIQLYYPPDSTLTAIFLLLGVLTGRSRSSTSNLARRLRTSPCPAPSSACSSRRTVRSWLLWPRTPPLFPSGIFVARRKPRLWTPAAGSTRSAGTTPASSCLPEAQVA